MPAELASLGVRFLSKTVAMQNPLESNHSAAQDGRSRRVGLAREETSVRKTALTLATVLAVACASTPAQPPVWIRDDAVKPDIAEARRDHSKCDNEGRIARSAIWNPLSILFGARIREYRSVYYNCMRSDGWILLTRRPPGEPWPDGGIDPAQIRCAGRTC